MYIFPNFFSIVTKMKSDFTNNRDLQLAVSTQNKCTRKVLVRTLTVNFNLNIYIT